MSQANGLCVHKLLEHPLKAGGPSVETAVDDLRKRVEGKEFSDIIDDEGHQYVDLVLQGGGLLGIALVGYVYVLEKAGIRFLGIAGSSAGAINALLIAALGPPSEAKSEKLLKHLALLDASQFLDGGFFARSLSAAVSRGAGKLSILSQAAFVFPGLVKSFGLHPGRKFLSWLDDILNSEGVETCEKLDARMSILPKGLRLRSNRDDEEARKRFKSRLPGRLAIVAVDASTKTKFVFPEMADLIWDDVGAISPSRFVRASMSIPYFFEPSRVECDRRATKAARWKEYGYEAELPEHHLFVDGGVVSNFPINIFHATDVVPFAPTLGVRLGMERRAPDLSSIGGFSAAWIGSARQALDFDFLYNNPDYQHLIGTIETEGFNWLNFNLGPEEKLQLFARGAEAAIDFLEGPKSENGAISKKRMGFDWGKYKALREKLAEADVKSKDMQLPVPSPRSNLETVAAER
ncbi:MAG: patatin-like phospholipase family protein [Paludisphaera borealis]|uniref:patatin-like phospholipase family protein n=1 Tax=Paludisphaera borealis TaxID=1387353 RepID=UPI00284501BB|nr:patatin-like phospholipase family protein [Paludisphaera borealis]MDR3620325.1 patatin-like phospholipase family protein [Paludisphaera borealis]